MKPLPARVCTHKRARRSKRAKVVAGAREKRFAIRCDELELAAWTAAAGLADFLSTSDWLREVANKAARRAPLCSSADQTWNTPRDFVVRVVRAFGPIGLDPCSNETSVVGARVEWRLERDGDSLERPWIGYGLIYINPPFGRALARWAEKIVRTAARGEEIVVLVPNRPDAQWFKRMRLSGDRVNVEGRFRFRDRRGRSGNAPFPSAVFYFGPRRALFRERFGDLGEYVPAQLGAASEVAA